MNKINYRLKFENIIFIAILKKITQFLKVPSFFFLTLIVTLAIFGPFFLRNPLEISTGPRLIAPSFEFLFGTDQ